MELIYVYIKRFGDFIYNQEMQLSNDFEVTLEDKILKVKKTDNYLSDYYGERIKNISLLVGKNGSGKTTILDILGMCRQDRLKNSVVDMNVKDEYLLLYYLGKDNSQQDMFGIELLGENVLDNMLENYYIRKEDISYDRSKTSIGLVFKYENNKFISVGKHFFDFEMKGGRLNEIIKFAYLGESYRYSNRNRKYSDYNAWDGGYIAERWLLSKASVYTKYIILRKCIANEIAGFDCSMVKVRFVNEIDFDYRKTVDEDYEKKYADKVELIKNKLPLWKKFRINSIMKIEANSSKKQKYILDLYARCIMDMIVNGLYPLCKKEEENREKINGKEKDIQINIEYIKGLAVNESSMDQLGKPVNFIEELRQIENLIEYLQKESIDNYLRILARYVGSRIHETRYNEEFGYVDVLEQMTKELNIIPEENFSRKGIEFFVDKEEKEYQGEFLKKYSELYAQRNSWHSYIGGMFKVYFEGFSEGEERFLDTIAKVADSVYENRKSQLIVLLADEPDQALHPEWSRRFIDIIIQELQVIDYKGDIQIILSTHSPYMISDILPSNVFMLDRDGDNRMLCIKRMDKSGSTSCLGANIYDLMKNQFFMDNSVGEYVTKKINSVAKEIRELNVDNKFETEKLECFIEQLGEPIIQKILKRQLQNKKVELNLIQNKEGILERITNKEDKERVREYLRMFEDKRYDKY